MLITLAVILVISVLFIIVLVKSVQKSSNTVTELQAKIKDLEEKNAIINKQSEIANSTITVNTAYDELFTKSSN